MDVPRARFLTASIGVVTGLLCLIVAMAASSSIAGAATPPAITSVTPATGPAAGGTVVTITGTDFAAGASVTFNGVAGTNVTVTGTTTITVTTPGGSPGPVTILITNPDGLGTSIGGVFSYLGAAPTITSVTPASGTSLGGTTVTITGTDFQGGATVRFGGTLATAVTVVSSTTITASTPAMVPGTVHVQVTNPDTQTSTLLNAFTFTPLTTPTISSVSPTSGTTGGGTSVTITGTGFVAGAIARFGNTNATSTVVVSSTQITAVTPPGSGVVAVRVTNPDTQSAQLNGAFTYVSAPAPTLTGVSPNSGVRTGGNTVTLTGTNFLPGLTVRFGTTTATNVNVISSTQITAVVPAAASPGTVSVQVTNPDGRSAIFSNAYTYLGTLAITSVSPTSGTTGGGTPVTITGVGFVPGASVRFGTTTATTVTVVSTNQILVVAPARSAGTVSIRVTNPNGELVTRENAYTYVTTAAPTVTSVTPSSGPLAGGNTVTIIGTSFNHGATVRFGTRVATSVTWVSTAQLSVVVPAGASLGNVAVRVDNTDGRSGSRTNAYTYVAGLTATGISPVNGTTAGGTDVTITGTNFTTPMTVLFGGTPATNVTVTSSTTLTARTPARPAGVVSVTIQAAGMQATLTNAFTYRQPATVTSITPNSGPSTGGTLIIVTGTGFTAGSTVTVGGVPATEVTLVSATQITARTPARPAGAAEVQVRAADTVLATGTPTFIYQALIGTITGGSVPTSGVSMFVFGGGGTGQLVDLAAAGCGVARISFWATVGGRWYGYTPAAPTFVNQSWNNVFAAGIPANTPILGACR
jgi:hypothetical protein